MTAPWLRGRPPDPRLPLDRVRRGVGAVAATGRGDSTDTAPYAVEREIEDLGAVREATGAVYASADSSGVMVIFRAVAAGVPFDKLAVMEPPFRVEGAPPRPLPRAPPGVHRHRKPGRRRRTLHGRGGRTAPGNGRRLQRHPDVGRPRSHGAHARLRRAPDGRQRTPRRPPRPHPHRNPRHPQHRQPRLVAVRGGDHRLHAPQRPPRRPGGQVHQVSQDVLVEAFKNFFR